MWVSHCLIFGGCEWQFTFRMNPICAEKKKKKEKTPTLIDSDN